MYLFTHLSLALPSLALSLSHSSLFSRYRCLSRTRYYCSLSHTLFSRYCRSLFHMLVAITHSLTFASSFSHICAILQCVVLVPHWRHPCHTLMPSLSHCPLHTQRYPLRTLSAILFPQLALSFSHLSTVLFPRIPFSSRTPSSIGRAADLPFPRTPSSIGCAADPPSPRVTSFPRAAVPLAPYPPLRGPELEPAYNIYFHF